MNELVIFWLISGSYGFTILASKFLHGKIEKAASKEDVAKLEGKIDKIYNYLLYGKIE